MNGRLAKRSLPVLGSLAAGFDALPASIAVLDRRGVIIFVNTPWRRFAAENGFGAVACGVGTNYLAVCDRAAGADAEEARRAAAGIRAVIAGARAEFTLEYGCPTPDAMRWFGLRVSRFRERGALRVLVAHYEVTELKQIELALRENEAGLRLLVEHIPALVTTTDTSLLVLSAVGAGLQDLGLRPEQIVGHRLPELLAHVDPNAPAIAAHRRALAGEAVAFEARWMGHFYQSRVEPLHAADGRIVGTVGIGVDATELQRANDERLRSAGRIKVLAEVSRAFAEARLDMGTVGRTIVRVISETMNDGCAISLVSADGRVLQPLATHHANPEARALLDQLLSQTPWAVDDALVADVLRAGQPLRLWLATPSAWRDLISEAYWPYIDRFPVCGILLVPLRVDGRIIGLLAVWRDRSEHEYGVDDEVLMQELADRAALAIANARLYSELERRVQERTVQLQAAYGELEAFSYSVSHDLRAPLRSISGFAQALREDYYDTLTPDGQHLLERVLAGGRRMEELIDDLLTLSRTARAPLHRQPVSLSALAREIDDEIRRTNGAREVTFVVAPDVTADGDARLLHVVMENLLGNAWKYTGKHGTAHIEFGVREQGGERVYFVRDDGAGFDMQYADKLFGPFQRLHSLAEFSGSGIGLATVQRIIARHGGRIWAEAAVEQGATFSFTLGAE